MQPPLPLPACLQTAWGVAFHSGGDFLASCSMDHTAKLWDTGTARVRQTFRGHVDAVNAIVWQPFAVHLATASGDKTVSLWDARTGLCVQVCVCVGSGPCEGGPLLVVTPPCPPPPPSQTFYGHTNAVNDVTFSLRGDVLASCDADGVVRLWDIRMVAESGSVRAPCSAVPHRRADLSLSPPPPLPLPQVTLGRTPIHALAFDRSAVMLAAGCEDGVVRIIDCSAAAAAPPKPGAGSAGSVPLSVCAQLAGHKDAVQTVAFDPTSQFLVSSGNDATLRTWAE
jgi:sperm-associated antigen 16 protein